MNKLTSRKFWLAIGGSASGIATLIAGVTATNETLALVLSIAGICLTALSIIAYEFAEAMADTAGASSVQSMITETVTTQNTVTAEAKNAQTFNEMTGKVFISTEGAE